jgi:hypothetical protein
MVFYKLVIEHANATMKEIAEAEGIEYSHGMGFYQLTKREKISDSKELVLWLNEAKFQSNAAEARHQCGVAVSGEVVIEPSNVPPKNKLFVQSTSSNRKVPTDVAVLFRMEGEGKDGKAAEEEEEEEDDDQPAKKKRVAETNSEFAIKFDEILQEIDSKAGEIDDENLQEFFNVPIATKWNECDCNVPKKFQLSSLWQLSQLSQVEWERFDVQTVEPTTEGGPQTISSLSAQGTLNLFPEEEGEGEDDEEGSDQKTVSVRLEYRAVAPADSYALPLFIYLTSIGNIWGCAHGVRSELPFVVTNEIQQTASDDGNGFREPMLIPGTEGSEGHRQQFESILGNMIVNFNLACRNWN